MTTTFLGEAPMRVGLKAMLVGAIFAGVAAGCGGGGDGNGGTGPDPQPADLAFVLTTPPGSNAIATVSVEITGPGLDSTLVFNLTLVNGVASGTARVPAGSGRRIMGRAFDAAAVNTHRGDTTVTLVEGTNPPVGLKLLPLVGGVPLTLTFGTTVVSVGGKDTTLQVGDTLRYTATAVNAQGGAVPAGSILWASSNPAVASVSASGLVTALVAGSTSIVATYEGAAASRVVTVPINTPITVTPSVASGNFHSCYLDAGARLYCWGLNDHGQLGDGTTVDRLSPTRVTGNLPFVKVTIGHKFTCGLTASNLAFCWGDGADGKLGGGGFSNQLSPVPVSGGLSFSMIDAGQDHACGIATGGTAYCWGNNPKGYLGDGTYQSRNVPTAVAGGLVFQTIDAGIELTCGLVSGGGYCWGRGTEYGVGNGSFGWFTTPQSMIGGLSFTTISAGFDHGCGLVSGGAAYCWGRSDKGQIGDGSYGLTDFPSPVAVSGGMAYSGIPARIYRTCGLTVAGSAYCWGQNNFGQVGNGTTADQVTPSAVQGGLLFDQLAPGEWHTCGIASDQHVYCWGRNDEGQIGDGTTVDRHVPVLVK